MRLGGKAMVIGVKDIFKLFSISIMTCCAAFVCTLFLNYNIDLVSIENEITTEVARVMYDAQVSMGKITAAVTGGCLIATSAVILLFYIKNHIDVHAKELGILKALGYSNIKIAKHFWIFGLSVFVGCVLGFLAAFFYLPTFYEGQNADGLFPKFDPQFHPLLTFALTGAPTIFFMAISVLYACFKLNNPVMNLLREKSDYTLKHFKEDKNDCPFLKGLSSNTRKSKKTLVFLVAFSAFCFSAMVQMSLSMNDLMEGTMAWMILSIGLILAFMTLLMSLTSVIKGNAKTIAMMRAFGYEDSTCSLAVLGAYRPISYIGFAIGSAYQYALLKLMFSVVFADLENVPEYKFSFKFLVITLIAFIIVYELVMYLYSLKIRKCSIKNFMLE